MRFTGHLQEWNEQRGFGFIRPEEGGDDIFVHVSALPVPRPGRDELLTFGVALDRQGRKKAVDVRRQAVEVAALLDDRAREGKRLTGPAHGRVRRHRKSGVASVIAPAVVLAGLAWYGYGAWSQRTAARVEDEPDTRTSVSAQSASFTCDGRTHCSQMQSCEEAKYFLKNCPGVQMDGNHDGLPCEQQWCTAGR